MSEGEWQNVVAALADGCIYVYYEFELKRLGLHVATDSPAGDPIPLNDEASLRAFVMSKAPELIADLAARYRNYQSNWAEIIALLRAGREYSIGGGDDYHGHSYGFTHQIHCENGEFVIRLDEEIDGISRTQVRRLRDESSFRRCVIDRRGDHEEMDWILRQLRG
jgi:hypothetical protein